MSETPHIPIIVPILVGVGVILCTIFIHALSLLATVSYVRHEKKAGRTGVGFWVDIGIVAKVMFIALIGHLVEIALWAFLFLICGEFHEFGAAYYHSAVNFTTLGYGDLVMTPSWRLLGALEAADGLLMFGLSTAVIFAVIQNMVQTRFVDLRT